MSGTLIIRADANATIGTGHVMRCLALGQAWKDAGGEVVFVTATRAEGLLDRLRGEGFYVHELNEAYPAPGDWAATSQVLHAYPGSWVVLDGYHFDEAYQRRVKEASHRLLVIDDMAHLAHYYADIVLNQNLHAEQLKYHCEPYTRLLLGTRYVILRREFLKWRGWQREIPEVARKVLVTLGGSDPENFTLKVIQALQQAEVDGLEAIVVAGATNPHYEKLLAAVQCSPTPIRLERNVTDMPGLMAWADVAIAAAGSTVWELAYMGLASLLLVLADNQCTIAEELDRRGIAVNLGGYGDLYGSDMAKAAIQVLTSTERRQRMAFLGKQLVEGEGNARVLMHLTGRRLRLRKACAGDCRILWEWASDPTVRTSSFSPEPIPWERHVQWFMSKLEDPNCLFYIALDDQDEPVGQIRFDVYDDQRAEISVSVEDRHRRRGYGSLLIEVAVENAFAVTALQAVKAFIKPENKYSIKAFEKAGFQRVGLASIKGNSALHYVRARNHG